MVRLSEGHLARFPHDAVKLHLYNRVNDHPYHAPSLYQEKTIQDPVYLYRRFKQQVHYINCKYFLGLSVLQSVFIESSDLFFIG